jgi:membrane dipeptidase
MNRLGMMVDVSHASDRAVDDILAASKRPVFASHANARALAKVNRNLTDERIRRICKGGGVVGVNFHVPHLTPKGSADAKDVAAHAQWIKKLGGEGCAAVGGDLDGRIKMPTGLEDAAKLQELVPALREEGFSPAGVEGALYGNFIEYWKRVEAADKPADREAK